MEQLSVNDTVDRLGYRRDVLWRFFAPGGWPTTEIEALRFYNVYHSNLVASGGYATYEKFLSFAPYDSRQLILKIAEQPSVKEVMQKMGLKKNLFRGVPSEWPGDQKQADSFYKKFHRAYGQENAEKVMGYAPAWE